MAIGDQRVVARPSGHHAVDLAVPIVEDIVAVAEQDFALEHAVVQDPFHARAETHRLAGAGLDHPVIDEFACLAGN